MFERFTERARTVMDLARREAERLNHNAVGTEHLLLGLIKEGSGVAANVLEKLDADLEKVRKAVEKRAPPSPDAIPRDGFLDSLPLTKRAPDQPRR